VIRVVMSIALLVTGDFTLKLILVTNAVFQ
jgi:hypothetical protein